MTRSAGHAPKRNVNRSNTVARTTPQERTLSLVGELAGELGGYVESESIDKDAGLAVRVRIDSDFDYSVLEVAVNGHDWNPRVRFNIGFKLVRYISLNTPEGVSKRLGRFALPYFFPASDVGIRSQSSIAQYEKAIDAGGEVSFFFLDVIHPPGGFELNIGGIIKRRSQSKKAKEARQKRSAAREERLQTVRNRIEREIDTRSVDQEAEKRRLQLESVTKRALELEEQRILIEQRERNAEAKEAAIADMQAELNRLMGAVKRKLGPRLKPAGNVKRKASKVNNRAKTKPVAKPKAKAKPSKVKNRPKGKSGKR